MKKRVAIILAITLVFTLCACSSSKNDTTKTKHAYMLSFPTYSLYYLFDTEANTATSFIYYKEDNLAVSVVSGKYSGTVSSNSTVKVSFSDGGTKWTETVKFDSKMSSIKVSMGSDPTEATYMTTDVNRVISILEKNG